LAQALPAGTPNPHQASSLRRVQEPLVSRYRDRLPVTDATPVVSLGEGSTPLLAASRLSERLGLELWLKCESANPTGSFKDRGMTVAVSKAVEEGVDAVVCASTGNTAASAAAYAARAGIRAAVLQPAGAVAAGKLAQARALGARILDVRGSFDQALAAARELAAAGTHALVNSLNPYRLEGQKTAAFRGPGSPAWSPGRRRSGPGLRRARSGSRSPRTGLRRKRPSSARAAPSSRSRTRRSSLPGATSPGSRASSASRLRPPA